MEAPECLLPNLLRIASRCGVRVVKPFDDPLGFAELLVKELGSRDPDEPTGVTLEDLMLLEDCVVSSIEALESEGPLSFEQLTPLARLYYTEFRGISPEEYNARRDELGGEEEDLRFAEFARRLGRRLSAGVVKRYLEHMLDTVRRYGFSKPQA